MKFRWAICVGKSGFFEIASWLLDFVCISWAVMRFQREVHEGFRIRVRAQHEKVLDEDFKEV